MSATEKIKALIAKGERTLNVTKRTVEVIISNLVDKKIIERQGSKKVGEWIILDPYENDALNGAL
ncbi:MAG: hypothetical protein LBG31_05610 [Prevotellaceae bacterium]|jgi:predicted HTH transcriptional regulator|nr:hypothetical protein [Prevotellaceae bacterium]